MTEKDAYQRLVAREVKPSVQRLAIMHYLMNHYTHPTVDQVYHGLCKKIPTLSRTTVYNTLRLLSERGAAQMITIDDHHVCYDGNTTPHVHFFCRQCGKVIDLFNEQAPESMEPQTIDGHLVETRQLYYKGICSECQQKEASKRVN